MSKKKEKVSVSFHYIERKINDGNDTVKFSIDEFKAIYSGLEKIKKTNSSLDDEESKLRFGKTVIIKQIEISDNFSKICGIFENTYSGHSFRNSERGNITADSLNFRPFFFMLYLSDSGKIYIASQYLGHYGGYTSLKNTIEDLIVDKKGMEFYSFNTALYQIDNFVPKEVIINVAQKSSSITGKNKFAQNVAITITDKNKSTDYQDTIKRKFLSLFQNPRDKIIAGLEQIFQDNELISMNDKEIEGCKIIGTINKKQTTIYLLDGINFATKFPLNLTVKSDGHPDYEEVKQEILQVLTDNIIARQEDV